MVPMHHDLTELALRVYEGLGDSRSLALAICARYGEWDTIATMRCDPVDYPNGAAYATAAAATAFLKKAEDLPTSFDRAAEAKSNFWKGERDCYNSNQRLGVYAYPHLRYLNPEGEEPDARIAEFFRRVKKRIESWIGTRPPSHLHGGLIGRHGPGSTFSDRGGLNTIADKMNSSPSRTSGTLWYLPQWLGTQWGTSCASSGREPVLVRGNRFATVPKDATKDRCIAAEPSINVFFQLGMGAELRKRLKNATGIDLDNAQDIHRQVACEASIRGHLATLDLSNASDSVSTSLVRLCLPRRWHDALADLRSAFTLVDGKWVHLQKFSSMGNGYTFELETLVFLGLCCEALSSEGYPCLPGSDVYVFGDDIIVPVDGAQVVTAVLNYCGLRLNLSKSFVRGPFRESCGGDFWLGKPVRGFYLKEAPHEPQHYVKVANGLNALDSRLQTFGFGGVLRRAWFLCLDALPVQVRGCRGPSDLGDLVIHDRQEFWQIRKRNDIRYVRVYRPAVHRKVRWEVFDPDVVLACATYALGWGDWKGSTREGFSPRDSVRGYKVGWVPWS